MIKITDKDIQSLIDARKVLYDITNCSRCVLENELIYIDSVCAMKDLDDVLERMLEGWKEHIKDGTGNTGTT